MCEKNTSSDSYFPAVRRHQNIDEWREDERSDAGPAHSYAGGQGSLFVEVESNHDDRR